MLVISWRISGWRVTDSMTFPKMYPTPIPGPIVPSPAPTPSAMALPALVPYCAGSTAAITFTRSDAGIVFTSLVLGGGRAAEVDGCKRGEDEGLKRCDQADLE